MRRGMVTGLVGLVILAVLAGTGSVSHLWQDMSANAGHAAGPDAQADRDGSPAVSPAGTGREDALEPAAPSVSDTPLLPDLRMVSVPFSSPRALVPALSDITGGAAYRVSEGEWGGFPQKVHALTIDPASSSLTVRPVLSYERLFGFETLSVMAERWGALAAVNGGFAYTDGRPAGTVMIDGTLMHPSDPRFPSLLIGRDSVSLQVLHTRVTLNLGKATILADAFNPWPVAEGITLLTPAYGSTDRVEQPHLALRVTGGKVEAVHEQRTPVAIPQDGFLVVAVGAEARRRVSALGTEGVAAAFAVNGQTTWPADTRHAMSCGSYLVREGVSVVPERDIWIGPMDGLAPRTAVGVGAQGQLVFVVAEGRIPGGPAGLSGDMLGALLVEMGLVEAAMLDGGASSGLMINKAVVSRLSGDRERPLPTGFVLLPVSTGG